MSNACNVCVAVLALFAFANCQNTTTTAPSTSTKPPVTTTVAPKTTTEMPVPPPAESAPVVTYSLSTPEHNKTIVCLLAKFSAKIALTYNNTENKLETGYVSLTNNSVVNAKESVCGENETKLTININGLDDKLVFFVAKNDKKYYVSGVDVIVNSTHVSHRIPLGPKGMIKAEMVNQTLFESPKGKSYRCDSAVTETMTSEPTVKYNVKLEIADMQMDAFRDSEDTNFRTAQRCAADEEISDIIPIAVGAALAALVVIVLIAYFIGRRRSRRLAYQSV